MCRVPIVICELDFCNHVANIVEQRGGNEGIARSGFGGERGTLQRMAQLGDVFAIVRIAIAVIMYEWAGGFGTSMGEGCSIDALVTAERLNES